MRPKTKIFKIFLMFICIILALMVKYKDIVYTSVHPVFQSIEGQRISIGISNYEKEKLGDFYIRYIPGDEEVVNRLRETISIYGPKISDFFDYEAEKTMEVILFSNEDDLHGMLRIPKEHSTMGAYSGGKIHILSPWGFTRNQGDKSMLDNVFVHELAHLIVDNFARGNYPLWFTEGSALYMEYYFLDYEWGSDIEAMEPITLQDITNSFSSVDEYHAYRHSFLLVKGLIEKYGRDNYIDLIRTLGRGVGFEDALYMVYGINMDDLEIFIQ